MKQDITLAGFVVTADEWDSLETGVRFQLVTAARASSAPRFARGSGPIAIADPTPADPYETYELFVPT